MTIVTIPGVVLSFLISAPAPPSSTVPPATAAPHAGSAASSAAQLADPSDTEPWGPPLIQVYRVVNPIRCGMRVVPAPAPPPNTRVEHADASADPKFVVKHDPCGSSRR